MKELQEGTKLGPVHSTLSPCSLLNQNVFPFSPVTSLWLFFQTHGSHDVEGTSEPPSPPSCTTVGRERYPVSV